MPAQPAETKDCALHKGLYRGLGIQEDLHLLNWQQQFALLMLYTMCFMSDTSVSEDQNLSTF